MNLRLERQTAEEIILTWLPVTISQSGYSNGFKVSGYKVYVNDIYCMETDSAAVDNVSITNERLRNLGKRHDLTRMQFVVRTLSVLGESADSNVVEVLSAETSGSTGKLATGGRLHSEGNETRRNSDGSEKDGMVKGDDEQLNDNVPNALHPSTSLSDELPTDSGPERHGNVLQTPDLLNRELGRGVIHQKNLVCSPPRVVGNQLLCVMTSTTTMKLRRKVVLLLNRKLKLKRNLWRYLWTPR